MCRSTADAWVAIGGIGLAGISAVLRMHWDLVKDRKAWRVAAGRNDHEADNSQGERPEDDRQDQDSC